MWPFVDEHSFWVWATDPDAVLIDQDEDVMLHDPAGLTLLLGAAEDADCPKQRYCAAVLHDYSRRIVGWQISDAYSALQVAAARAPTSHDAWVRRWADYVTRLFSYLSDAGPVSRADAEQMSADLLTGPAERLTVQIAASKKHWQCAESGSYPTYLYIDRKSGAFRMTRPRPLSEQELSTLHRDDRARNRLVPRQSDRARRPGRVR
ncbi:hypothetical protein [Nocardia sp. NPDC058480]|uniref:hypothetical protein n=1 Tax=unclassified Nocardia TaxID=2637762 RepID=UPI0036689857